MRSREKDVGGRINAAAAALNFMYTKASGLRAHQIHITCDTFD